jgi:hypothetical protein
LSELLVIISIHVKMLNLAEFKFVVRTAKNEFPYQGFLYIFVQLSDHVRVCTCLLFPDRDVCFPVFGVLKRFMVHNFLGVKELFKKE